MLDIYQQHVEERATQGLPPLALDAQQTAQLIENLKDPAINAKTQTQLVDLLTHRIPSGVDEAAYVKAGFLNDICLGNTQTSAINPSQAATLLGTMYGGYNINPLIKLLDNTQLKDIAIQALGQTLLMFDAYYDVVEKAKTNPAAQQVLQLWAEGQWFTNRANLAEKIDVTVFKVDGEINTDDLSPASEAWSRPDIPLHAKSMLISRMPDALAQIAALKADGQNLAFVGDVVGTGSSRKSAINSVLWHMGNNIAYTPNKRAGGVILGGNIAPIFFNTAEDAGALPIECDVSQMNTGDKISIYPYKGEITNSDGTVISRFNLTPSTLADEVRAGGRISLIIGRGLTEKARAELNMANNDLFLQPKTATDNNIAYTLAQKIVGKACGMAGAQPGNYYEPKITTVGSQDTTGAMTRDELKELACLGFSSDLVMQSFCHTAAYPKPIDISLQHKLPDFIRTRGGVSLRPGDGVIHSWLNRMILPDTVGTGGDSHTRFPLGISFPAGSGLVAFAAALGVMPLDMPESVLVRFKGKMQTGITLRDLVNAIPYTAIQQGLLTVEKANKKNVFSGRIIEIEGLPDLKVEQAFELSDSSAERSAAACTVHLNTAPVIEYINSNISLLRWMLASGYGDVRSINRRIEAMQAWIADPQLMQADANASYAAVIEIDLNNIKEPIVACPNDPDDVKLLSEVAGGKIDEVFIGSCMTNIGHYRAAASILQNKGAVPTRLWVAPPTRMDEKQLTEEGVYSIFGSSGARTEMPGCSLCMGNQARVADEAVVFSTSTRNFPNRLGKDAQVYLGSAELAAVCALTGHLPSVAEYQTAVAHIEPMAADIYRYLNFDQMDNYQVSDETIIPIIATNT